MELLQTKLDRISHDLEVKGMEFDLTSLPTESLTLDEMHSSGRSPARDNHLRRLIQSIKLDQTASPNSHHGSSILEKL